MKGMAYHGWKHGLPDKFWPVTLDNFFDNPDKIRELGLQALEPNEVIKSSDDGGKWPGYRSLQLCQIDQGLEKRILSKIFSCYFNLDFEQIFWNFCEMQFQLIPGLDKDKNNIKNKGWIHRDSPDSGSVHAPSNKDECELAGLIYLTPDIERDTGTSLFNMKKDKPLHDWDKTVDTRKQLHSNGPISDEEVETAWKNHRSCFIEKARFENIYNSLVMYDAKEWHAGNSYYSARDNRLTLVFFIGGIRADKWPLQRIREGKC